MRTFVKVLPLFLFGIGLAVGCKADSADNVGACEDYVAAVNCGDIDVGIDCSIYKDLDCDISDYFDCLTDNLTCEDMGGTKVLTPGPDYASCASKANCS